MTAAAIHMTPDEVTQFHELGYAGPYAACSPAEMLAIGEQLDATVHNCDGLCAKARGQSRHLDSKVVWDLCSNPEIVHRMAAIAGPDLILWRSHFFDKKPGDREIPWHQDLNYWPLDPLVNITAWLSITHSDRENSCVQFIPGSHKEAVPHIPATEGMVFGEMADPSYVDTSKSIDMILKPGEFVLFNEKTLHHSEPNRSDKRRCGLAVRVTIPTVTVDHSKLFPKHRCIVLHGQDTHQLNQMQQPPTD